MLDGLIKIFFKKKGSELEIINEVLVYILAINSWDELESVLNKKKEILEFDFLKKDKNLKSLLKKVFTYFKNKNKNDFTVSELRKFRENVKLTLTYIETNYFNSKIKGLDEDLETKNLANNNSLESLKLKIDDINSKIEYVRAKVYFLKNSNELETQNTIESIIDNLDRKILDEELKSGLKTEIQNIEFILKKLLKIKIKNNLSHPIDDELFINKILALIFLLKLKINFKFLDDCETNNNSDFVSLLKIVLDNINVNLENYSQSSISAYNGIKENYLNSLIHNLNMLADDAQNNSKIKTQFHNLLSKTYKLIISYENNFSSELKNEIIKSSGEYDIENFPNLSFLISLRKELEILSSEHLDFEHYEKNFKHLLYNLTKEVESFSKNDLSVDFDYVKSLLEELVDLVSNKKKELEKDKELNYKINTFLNETINYLKLLEIRFYLLFFKNAKESLKDKYSFYYDNLAKYYSFYAKLEINSIFEHDIMNYRFISKKLKRIISPIKADPKSPFWNSENWEENSKRINTKEHFDEINSYIEDMIYELKLIEKKQKIKIEKLL